VFRPITALIPVYENDDPEDATHTYVRPLIWDGSDPPEQLIQRPDKLFISPEGTAGNETAALNYFRERPHRQRHPVQYDASILADFED
jgi:hypothetical protein